MSFELRQVTTSVSVNVTKNWELPIQIKVVGTSVYVYPTQLELKVASGKVTRIGIEKVAWPGEVVEFKNEVVKKLSMLNLSTTDYKEIFAKSSAEILFGTEAKQVKFTIDGAVGVIYADVPCYAVLLFNRKDYDYDLYEYKQPIIVPSQGGSTSGTQLEASISQSYQDLLYIIHKPVGWPSNPAQVVTEHIKMHADSDHEAYRLQIPTILTANGEYVLPEKWGTPEYKKADAYGTGKAGPDPNDPYVQSTNVVVHGRIDGEAMLSSKSYSMPGHIKGAAELKEAKKAIPLQMAISELPSTIPISDSKKTALKKSLDNIRKETLAEPAATSVPFIKPA